ncbi:MAG: HIT family protein [Bacteroidales bacterium]|jgi:histidine triad (HIT) family protein
MASIFSRIIKGEIPSYKVAENDDFYAFLDINPQAKGHVLVVPKLEIDYIFDLPEDLYRAYWDFAKKVAKAIKIAIPCERVGVAVVGLDVPHSHIHLIPISKVEDMNFSKEKVKLTDEEMKKIAKSISEKYRLATDL